jgi:hypothetical protein
VDGEGESYVTVLLNDGFRPRKGTKLYAAPASSDPAADPPQSGEHARLLDPELDAQLRKAVKQFDELPDWLK